MQKSPEELDQALGEFILRNSLDANRHSKEFTQAVGSAWLSDNLTRLAGIICPNEAVCSYLRDKPARDASSILATVVDALAHTLVGWPATTIAVRLLHLGLDKLCQDHIAKADK